MVFVTQTKLNTKPKKPDDYISWVGPHQAHKNALAVLLSTEPGNDFSPYWLQVKNRSEKMFGVARITLAELKKEQINLHKLAEVAKNEVRNAA